jgi:hypothetical protein
MLYISRHDKNITTTVSINTGARFMFAMVMGLAGFLLVRYSTETHPWAWGRILIGALMMLLAFIVVAGASCLIRRAR